MAARSFDDKRARILKLAEGSPAEAKEELKKYLADKNGYLVGEAASAVKTLELSELLPQLCEAFLRLLEDGPKSDKGCFGKNRIIEALLSFDAGEPEVYSKGLRHIQIEGSYPDPIDTAAPLRGLCAHALIHTRHRGALLDVTPLLFDKVPIVRSEAASALGSSGHEGAAAALHAKVLAGDIEPDVLGAVYKALLALFPHRYLPVVTSALLGESDATSEMAALALGESRVEGAFDALKRGHRAHRHSRAAEGVLLGIALLRSDAANDFLLSLVESAPDGEGVLALSALAMHRHDEALVGRLRKIVSARGSRKLSEVLSAKFGD